MSPVALCLIVAGVLVLAAGIAGLRHFDILDDGWQSGLSFVVAIVGAITLLCGVIGGSAIAVERSNCVRTGTLIDLPTRYVDGNIGCQIQVNGHWTPYERWLNVTNGGNR